MYGHFVVDDRKPFGEPLLRNVAFYRKAYFRYSVDKGWYLDIEPDIPLEDQGVRTTAPGDRDIPFQRFFAQRNVQSISEIASCRLYYTLSTKLLGPLPHKNPR